MPSHASPRSLSLIAALGLLGLSACPSVGDDVASSETLDPGTTTDPTAGTGETGETGEQSCSFPTPDPLASAAEQTIMLVNTGDSPRWLWPLSCGFYPVSVDGEDRRLGTRFACGPAARNACYDGCDGDFLTPPIRVDPGASHPWPFSGYVFDSIPIPSACRPDCVEPEVSSCGVGTLVTPGAMVSIDAWVVSDCSDPACACPDGEPACALDISGDWQLDGALPTKSKLPLAFVHGAAETVEFDLAG